MLVQINLNSARTRKKLSYPLGRKESLAYVHLQSQLPTMMVSCSLAMVFLPAILADPHPRLPTMWTSVTKEDEVGVVYESENFVEDHQITADNPDAKWTNYTGIATQYCHCLPHTTQQFHSPCANALSRWLLPTPHLPRSGAGLPLSDQMWCCGLLHRSWQRRHRRVPNPKCPPGSARAGPLSRPADVHTLWWRLSDCRCIWMAIFNRKNDRLCNKRNGS